MLPSIIYWSNHLCNCTNICFGYSRGASWYMVPINTSVHSMCNRSFWKPSRKCSGICNTTHCCKRSKRKVKLQSYRHGSFQHASGSSCCNNFISHYNYNYIPRSTSNTPQQCTRKGRTSRRRKLPVFN